MALMQLLSICYQKAFESAANPHKHWVFMTLQLIQTLSFLVVFPSDHTLRDSHDLLH